MTTRDLFTVVGRQTDCHLYEGDGTRPIAEQHMRVKYVPGRVHFPEDIGLWRREIEEEQTGEVEFIRERGARPQPRSVA